jgi:hypothetical protein
MLPIVVSQSASAVQVQITAPNTNGPQKKGQHRPGQPTAFLGLQYFM